MRPADLLLLPQRRRVRNDPNEGGAVPSPVLSFLETESKQYQRWRGKSQNVCGMFCHGKNHHVLLSLV